MSFDPHDLPVPDLGLLCGGCGYALAGLPSHRCPECGRSFDIDEHIPRGDFPMVIVNAKEVPLTSEIMGLMQAYQIPFMDALRHVDASFGYDRSVQTRSRLAVPRSCYFHAVELIRRQSLGLALPDPPPVTSGPDWSCDNCGEASPGNFELCWNCGEMATSPP